MCLEFARDTGVPLFASRSNWGCPEKYSIAVDGGVCGGISDIGASRERPGSAVLGPGPFKLRIPGFEHPPGEMPPRDVSQGTNPVVPLVEAGQQVEFPASRTEEDFSALDADFFERLQAIRHETGTDHVHAAHAVPAVV